MKRGTKIHWNSKGIYYSPCGMSTTYYKVVPVEKFNDVPIDERCKRCNDAFTHHSMNFLEVDSIFKCYSEDDTFWLILSCEYCDGTSAPYKDISICYIEFDTHLNNIKTEKTTIGLYNGKHIKKSTCEITTEKMNYLKRLSRIIEG